MPLVAPTCVEVPYAPRKWAQRLHASYRRWAVLVLHRRAGKTIGVLNHHQRAAMDDGWETRRLRALKPEITDAEITELLRGRYYWHVMPTRVQAKMVAWDKLKYYARAIPGVTFNEAELLVRYPPSRSNSEGSKLQLIGADNPDSLRGPGLSGVSFDEYSQQPENIFPEIISKALADHLGYAIFEGTIKGKDLLYRTHEAAKDDPDWFTLWQDIDESLATEEGITIANLERAMADDRKLVLKGLMTQDEFDQEWYLSVEAATKGAWFGAEMARATAEGRIRQVPYDAAMPVDTDWDLGIDDSMAIWFSQSYRSGEIRLIDYYEASGEGFPHFIKVLRDRPYVYGRHFPPHDIAVRELSTGKSRKDTAARLGLKFEEPVGKLAFSDGIDAARLVLARCWFDAEKTQLGLEALRHYKKQFNVRLQEFTGTPVHNIHSHAADAFRGLSVRYQPPGAVRRARDRANQDRATTPHGWMRG